MRNNPPRDLGPTNAAPSEPAQEIVSTCEANGGTTWGYWKIRIIKMTCSRFQTFKKFKSLPICFHFGKVCFFGSLHASRTCLLLSAFVFRCPEVFVQNVVAPRKASIILVFLLSFSFLMPPTLKYQLSLLQPSSPLQELSSFSHRRSFVTLALIGAHSLKAVSIMHPFLLSFGVKDRLYPRLLLLLLVDY